jgi:hypothetical protein
MRRKHKEQEEDVEIYHKSLRLIFYKEEEEKEKEKEEGGGRMKIYFSAYIPHLRSRSQSTTAERMANHEAGGSTW